MVSLCSLTVLDMDDKLLGFQGQRSNKTFERNIFTERSERKLQLVSFGAGER